MYDGPYIALQNRLRFERMEKQRPWLSIAGGATCDMIFICTLFMSGVSGSAQQQRLTISYLCVLVCQVFQVHQSSVITVPLVEACDGAMVFHVV